MMPACVQRVASRFIRAQIQAAAETQDFWSWMQQKHPRVKNPNPDGRARDIAPSTLKSYAEGTGPFASQAAQMVQRYFQQYQQSVQDQPQTEKLGPPKEPILRKMDAPELDIPAYITDVRKDRFVHFTAKDRAQEILDSGALLMRPPYKKFGIDAVTCVSLAYGQTVPEVQTTHLKKHGELVAIVFSTDAPPEVGYTEEVIWKTDVPFRQVELVSAEQALSMMKKVPDQIEESAQVYYEGSPALQKLQEWLEKKRKAEK